MTELISRNEELALTWPEKARAIVIADQVGYDAAANMKKDLATLRKGVIADNIEAVETAHAAHKAAVARRERYLAPIEEAEGILKASIQDFERKQEALRIERQKAIDAKAKLDAELDRKRREKEASDAKAEAERVRAEIKKKDEEIRLALAVAAQTSGASDDAVAAILEAPVLDVPVVAPVEEYMEPAPYIAPQVAAPTFERAKGLGIVRTWGAQITDLKALAGAVWRGEVPPNYIEGNMVALNQRARADKQLMRISGVIAVEK